MEFHDGTLPSRQQDQSIPQVEEGQQPFATQAVVSQALPSVALDETSDILAALQAIPGLTVVRVGGHDEAPEFGPEVVVARATLATSNQAS